MLLFLNIINTNLFSVQYKHYIQRGETLSVHVYTRILTCWRKQKQK